MTYENKPVGPSHRISEAREQFATIVNQVAFGGERVRLTRHGKVVAAVVPIGDLDLLEELEDAFDLADLEAALADPREPRADSVGGRQAPVGAQGLAPGRMAYRLEFVPSAVRDLEKAPPEVQRRLVRAIKHLASQPRPPGARALRGDRTGLRIRGGDYRILYEVDDEALVVTIGRSRTRAGGRIGNG